MKLIERPQLNDSIFPSYVPTSLATIFLCISVPSKLASHTTGNDCAHQSKLTDLTLKFRVSSLLGPSRKISAGDSRMIRLPPHSKLTLTPRASAVPPFLTVTDIMASVPSTRSPSLIVISPISGSENTSKANVNVSSVKTE